MKARDCFYVEFWSYVVENMDEYYQVIVQKYSDNKYAGYPLLND